MAARAPRTRTVTPEQLAATRTAEQRAAADILGVAEIVHLGYPDGYLQPTLDLRRDITRQIRRFRPDLVITQNPQRRLDRNPFIGHPDHLATGEATLAAVYPAARDHLNFPELWTEERLEPWKVRQVLVTGVEQPNLWIDVGDTFETRAGGAILAHASQVDPDEVEERMRERARRGRRAAGHRPGAGVPLDHPRMTRRGGGGGGRGPWGGGGEPDLTRAAGQRARAPCAGSPASSGRIAGAWPGSRALILVTVSIGVINPILLKLVIDNLLGPQDLRLLCLQAG